MALKNKMSKISKKDIRLINKVYQHSKRFMLRWPLSESDLNRFDYDLSEIESAIDRGILIVSAKRMFPNVEIDVLRVQKDFEPYVSNNTLYFLDQKREEKEASRKQMQRLDHIDEYKHERNSFEGWNLRNAGEKNICTVCMALNKPCEHGKKYIKKLPPEARVPKASASKTRWKQFKELFLKD